MCIWTTQCICMWMYVNMYVCMHIIHVSAYKCICIYTFVHTHLKLATTYAAQNSACHRRSVHHEKYAPHVHACHPHPNTHRFWSDMRSLKMPAGSVVIEFPLSPLCSTHTHTHRGWEWWSSCCICAPSALWIYTCKRQYTFTTWLCHPHQGWCGQHSWVVKVHWHKAILSLACDVSHSFGASKVFLRHIWMYIRIYIYIYTHVKLAHILCLS